MKKKGFCAKHQTDNQIKRYKKSINRNIKKILKNKKSKERGEKE